MATTRTREEKIALLAAITAELHNAESAKATHRVTLERAGIQFLIAYSITMSAIKTPSGYSPSFAIRAVTLICEGRRAVLPPAFITGALLHEFENRATYEFDNDMDAENDSLARQWE